MESGLHQRIVETSGVEDVKPPVIKDSSTTKQYEGFHTLCVMEFAVGTPAVTVDWMLSKIQASRNDGGGELLAELVHDDPGKVCIDVMSKPQMFQLDGI